MDTVHPNNNLPSPPLMMSPTQSKHNTNKNQKKKRNVDKTTIGAFSLSQCRDMHKTRMGRSTRQANRSRKTWPRTRVSLPKRSEQCIIQWSLWTRGCNSTRTQTRASPLPSISHSSSIPPWHRQALDQSHSLQGTSSCLRRHHHTATFAALPLLPPVWSPNSAGSLYVDHCARLRASSPWALLR